MEPKFDDKRVKYPMRRLPNGGKWLGWEGPRMPNIVTAADYEEHLSTQVINEGYLQWSTKLPWCWLYMVAPAFHDSAIQGASEGVYEEMRYFPQTEVACVRTETGEKFSVYFRTANWSFRPSKFSRAESERVLTNAMREMIRDQYPFSMYGEIKIDEIPERTTWQRLGNRRSVGAIEAWLQKPRSGIQEVFHITHVELPGNITFIAQPTDVDPMYTMPLDAIKDLDLNRTFSGTMTINARPYRFALIPVVSSINLREVFHPQMVLDTIKEHYRRVHTYPVLSSSIIGSDVSMFDPVESKLVKRLTRTVPIAPDYE